MHCRVAHCWRMICDQGESRGARCLELSAKLCLCSFLGGKADWMLVFSLTSCYCSAVRYWYNVRCLLALCRGFDFFWFPFCRDLRSRLVCKPRLFATMTVDAMNHNWSRDETYGRKDHEIRLIARQTCRYNSRGLSCR